MKRPRTWIVVTVVVATLAAAVIAGEAIARATVTNRLESTLATRDGLDVGIASTPALLQLATGRLEVTLVISDDLLGEVAACATDLPTLEVTTTSAGLAISTARSFRGIDLPVTVLLVPRSTETGWMLGADSVSVAGISIPAARAAALLDGGGVAADLLGEGITLSNSRSVTITNITPGAGHLALTIRTPLAAPGPGGSDNPVLGCLAPHTPMEGHE